MTETVGLLGLGHFGAYLVEGLRRAGPRLEIVVSPRNAERAREAAVRHGCLVAASNQEVVDRAETVLLATRPGEAAETVAALRFRPGHRLVSFCGSVPLKALAAAPARAVRAMASAAVAHGESTVVLYPDDARARVLLARLGPVLAMPDERTLEAGTALYGYYAMLFAVMAEGEAWARKNGLSRDAAAEIVGLALRGAGGARLRDRAKDTAAILESLATPGGLTERGLASLAADDALGAWGRALDAVLRRVRGEPDPPVRGGTDLGR